MGTISFHVPESTDRTIRALAAQLGIPTSAFVGQIVEEGLRMRRFPGIVFRSGPTGRRAGLSTSLDIWEIIAILRDFDDDEPAVLADYPGLTTAGLKTARAYYAVYPDEIEARLALTSRPEADFVAEQPVLYMCSPPKRSTLRRSKARPSE